MFEVEFGFNSTSRKRLMPALPRVGEIVDFDDGDDDRVVLRIDRLVHVEDDDGTWTYHCHCTVQENWIE